MKLLTSSIAMGDVERCHKVTARTKSKVSNSKLDSTTEVYCKIAVSESKADILQAFRSHVKDMRKLRGERESAAQAIAEAGSSGWADDSEEHDGMDSLLDEACSELGYDFEDSDDESY